MPLIKNRAQEQEAEAPKQPHLGLLSNEDGGLFTLPVQPGNIMMIVEDPSDPRKIFPIALVRVSRKRLEFQCPCGQSNCSRTVVFNATWSGLHPKGTPEISIKK